MAMPNPQLGRVSKRSENHLADAGSGDPAYRAGDVCVVAPVLSACVPRSANAEKTRIVAELERHLSVVEELEAVVEGGRFGT